MQPHFETPPKITISITNSCNLRCRYCYADCATAPSSRELTTQQWIDFIDYLVANGFIQVYFEGGEPLHRADFGEILRHCGRRLMTWVRTNGTLVTREVANGLKRLNVGTVLVDILGACAQTHDYLTGQRGSFAKARAAVGYLLEAGIPTFMLTILTRRNASELQDYLALAKMLGVPKVGILRLYPLGRAKQRWPELALSLDEQMRVIKTVVPPRGVRIMQSWHPKDHNCCWQGAAVNAYGDSIGCVYLREYVNFGNILRTPFLDTWHDNALYRQLRSGRVDASCSDCNATQGTRGGCRSTAYAFHGNWTAPDPFCANLNNGVDLRELPQRLLQKNS